MSEDDARAWGNAAVKTYTTKNWDAFAKAGIPPDVIMEKLG